MDNPQEKTSPVDDDAYALQTLPADTPTPSSSQAMDKEESDTATTEASQSTSPSTATTAAPPSAEDKYLTGKKLVVVMIGIMLS